MRLRGRRCDDRECHFHRLKPHHRHCYRCMEVLDPDGICPFCTGIDRSGYPPPPDFTGLQVLVYRVLNPRERVTA